MSVVDDTHSMPTSLKMRRFFGLFTRAMQRGTLNTRCAISHDTRLSSSWPVVATNTSGAPDARVLLVLRVAAVAVDDQVAPLKRHRQAVGRGQILLDDGHVVAA